MENPIDKQIREAMAQGKFDDLPGKGKPRRMEHDGTPPEYEMAFTMLKNGGFVPEEVNWMKEIDALKEQLADETDPDRRHALSREIQNRQLKVALFLERMRNGDG